MKKDNSIKITSGRHREISTSVVVKDKKYLILTEDLEPKDNHIASTVYLGGKIVLTKKVDCGKIPKGPSAREALIALVHGQHEMIAETLRTEDGNKVKNPSDYLDEVKVLLQKKSNKRALELLIQALEFYPSEPFLLSYYGCLEAILNKRYANGIDTCIKAITLLDERMSFGQEIFYPTFYLNLGRAYVVAKKRKEAVRAFKKGLSYDKENKDLLWEMSKLGRRRNPALPYLDRANPLNKYIGIILHKLDGRPS
jgi:tetratricopeptide (TPR) repeat protein